MRKLHSKQRENLILDRLQRSGFVSVAEIADTCGVTEMTARRDLDDLAAHHQLTRIHGGAIRSDDDTGSRFDAIEPSVDERFAKNLAGKQAIAQQAVQHVKAGDMVALDIGSTVQVLARRMRDMDVRVFTSSLAIASDLADTRTEVYLPGGRVEGLEPAVSGATAVEQLGEYWFDILFLGVSGLSTEGAFDYSLEDTQIKKAFLKRSRCSVVLADGSKFGRRAGAYIAPLSAIDVIITDRSPGTEFEDCLAEAGVKLEIAGAG